MLRYKLLILSLFLLLSSSALLAKSVHESIPSFMELCRLAAEDESVFATFRSSPAYRQLQENVSFELGEEYLKLIVKNYSYLTPYFEECRRGDNHGSPIVYDYGKWGWFSPTTLKYMKIGGDLIKQFGNTTKLHIVEIGGGYGGLCRVLSLFSGFASYTIIDFPDSLALAKKFLETSTNLKNVSFININEIDSLPSFDLLISNHEFSQLDKENQIHMIRKVAAKAGHAYIAMDFISNFYGFESLTIEELVSSLLQIGKKGKLEKDRPYSNYENLLLTWQAPPPPIPPVAKIRSSPFITSFSKLQRGVGVSYNLNGGRLGDNLASFFHAKWLAYKYNRPFITIPFLYSDQFLLDSIERKLSEGFAYKHTITITHESEILDNALSTLLIVPYFSECPFDIRWHRVLFNVNWDHVEFRKQVITSLTPKNPDKVLKLPSGCITVGVHLRRGTGFDSKETYAIYPLKFPPDSYYIEQIKRLTQIFPNKKLYVFIFTDDPHVQKTMDKFKIEVKDPNVEFHCREATGPNKWVVEDFVSMSKFDCFIRCQSNFSMLGTKLGQYAVLITPIHALKVGKQWIVDEVELTFDPANPSLMRTAG